MLVEEVGGERKCEHFAAGQCRFGCVKELFADTKHCWFGRVGRGRHCSGLERYANPCQSIIAYSYRNRRLCLADAVFHFQKEPLLLQLPLTSPNTSPDSLVEITGLQAR